MSFAKSKIIRRVTALVIASALFLLPAAAFAVPTSLDQQKSQAQNQAQTFRTQKEAQQQQASYISQQIGVLNTKIAAAQQQINQTNSQIQTTQGKIDSLNAQIAAEEKKINDEKKNLSELISNWYMSSSNYGLLSSVLSSNTLSDVVSENQYYESVKQQITSAIQKIKELKAQLAQQKADQDTQLTNLNQLKSSQVAQKKSLDNDQYTQYRLLNDTQAMVNELQQAQQSAEAKVAQIQAQIDALSRTSAWGDQIVSSNDSSWYYTQTGNQTHLGYSPYTVSQYGCLITSIAMVATRYGNTVTPSDIASNPALFGDDGSFRISPFSGYGVLVSSSRTIDWSVVNQQIDQGHPVIVSIYLPSVGAINADGSSHFIVIKGHNGDKYLMHDPVSGQRGYNRDQVRSMKLVYPL